MSRILLNPFASLFLLPAASVTATSAAVTCYAVDKETFDELLGNLKGIMEMTHRDRVDAARKQARSSRERAAACVYGHHNGHPQLTADET